MDYAYYYRNPRINIQKKEIVKKEIAFFDFDGTITSKDTLLEFIKFTKGRFRFYLGFIINFHYLIALKLKIISNQSAKEKILNFFFKNTSAQTFERYCSSFSRNILPHLLRPKAIEEITRLKEKNITVVIVSASPENWIEDWIKRNELQLIASKLEIKDGKLTGKLLGKNCHGNEKVSRIREVFSLDDHIVVAAYGDSIGDKPMLQLAEKAYYKPFV
jgi:phosphatidylglycerophosphatase C